jgi:uncharacterized protein
MTVEIRPYGDKCNLRCNYCYENPLRDNNLPTTPPDWEKIKEALRKQDTHFTVFGGDPLVTPIGELEEIWKYGKERWNHNGIQTNGTAITSQHIALFKKYSVHVGFSIDGPHMLNDARSAPSGELSATRRLTELANENLLKCMEAGVQVSLITTLHKLNVEGDRLDTLLAWFAELEEWGMVNIRLHLMENDDADELIPSDDDLFEALVLTYEMGKKSKIKFDLFTDFEKRLKAGKGGTCNFNGCDPCNTRAVQGIGPQGEETNCGRVNKEGIDFLKAEGDIPIRDYVLQDTNQSAGGCKGCEFWYACRGNCPGTGIGGDWRNRTTHCEITKRLMQYIVEDQDIKVAEVLATCENREHEDGHGDSYRDIPHENHDDYRRHLDKIHLPKLEVRS